MSGRSARKERQGRGGRDWSSLDTRMFSDDVRWVYSLAKASQADGSWDGPMGLALIPQMSRIAYEGFELFRKRRPAEAKGFERQYADELAAARHTVKLLDDNQKTLDDVIDEFEQIATDHALVFLSQRPMSVAVRDHRLYTTSHVATYQLLGILRSEADGTSLPYAFAHEVGSTLGAMLLRLGVPIPIPTPIRNPPGPAPRLVDTRRAEFFKERYGTALPLAAKEVLATIESVVNSAVFMFSASALDHPNALFRARLVTATHAIAAIEAILHRWDLDEPRVRAVVGSAAANRLRAQRALRNRCMHYGLPSSSTGFNANSPMYGIVEAVSPGSTYSGVASDLDSVLAALSNAFVEWRA